MDEINRADNTHWEGDPAGSAEFSSFNRLASMLISVPSDKIRAKLEEVKRGVGDSATRVEDRSSTETEQESRRDPD